MQSPDGTHHKRLRPQDQSNPFRRACCLIALCLLPVLTTCLVLWAVLHTWRLQLSASFNHDHDQRPATQVNLWTTCGSSPADAKLRGCRFDILSFAWQTPECYDDELMQDFLDYDTWQFYAHPNRTDAVVDLATALEGQGTLYVDWKYHVTHCTFMWQQMHRAYALRGYIDSHLDSYEHTLHCQWALIETDTPLGMVNVVAQLKYPECRKIGGVGWKSMAGKGSFAAKGHVHQRYTL